MTGSSNNPQPATSERAKPLRGRITVPGDKSISHRALMLASQALGLTTIYGLLEGEDVLATAEALRQCNVPISKRTDGAWVVNGVGIGGLSEPADVLDMGNAGTAARLMMGLLAPYPFHVQFTGDASLRKRPMKRVMAPLEQIGAQFWSREGGRLPLAMRGARMPMSIVYELPVASAQVKSAILLAGLDTPGTTTVIEREPTRDHTERMLKFFGVKVDTQEDERAWDPSPHPNLPPMGEGSPGARHLPSQARRIIVTGQPQQHYQDREFTVPADPSSAAFPLVAALLVPDSQITITNVCLNPTRTGLIDTLKEMGANIAISNQREVGGEPVGDITASYSILNGVKVPAERAPSMIDEYPILAIAAACAKGTTTMRGLSELRVKESDRLSAIVAGLVANGVDARAEGDDLIVTGNGKSPEGGGTVTTHFDHRIAMSFLVLGLVSAKPVTVDDTRAIATSFPNFMALMGGLGAPIRHALDIPPPIGGRLGGGLKQAVASENQKGETSDIRAPHLTSPRWGEESQARVTRAAQPAASSRRLVIAVDGPAASGKGTLARRIADHLGCPYLDTGSLYRAVGMRVLYANQDPHDVNAALAAARSIQEHDFANPKLRGERIGQAASIVSAFPEVRQALLEYQRAFAQRPQGAVLDGRDIGTVICPDADVKFFITATLEARAKRRHKELQDYGVTVDYQSVFDDLLERDKRDESRHTAPMTPADDAILLDTSRLNMQEVFELALQEVARVTAKLSQ